MARFFMEGVAGDRVCITGEDAQHIAKSLRMRPSETLTLCDMQGSDYACVIETVDPTAVWVQVLSQEPSMGETAVPLHLYQALPKGDKLDFIVQKATELGAASITPVLTERCISRPDAKSMQKKRERLERIALEAAKQSGRGVIPRIGELMHLSAALKSMKQQSLAILCYEGATRPLSACVTPNETGIALLVGPEGGFAPEEAEQAEQAGVVPVSLGRRILRCETAPLCALSAVLTILGEI